MNNERNFFMPKRVKILQAIILKGHFKTIFKACLNRFYANKVSYVLRRDLSLPIEKVQINVPLKLRPLINADIPILLNYFGNEIEGRGIIYRSFLTQLLKADIQKGYVSVINEKETCGVAWLIGSSENKKIRFCFGKRLPEIKENEVLLEGGFTIERYRNLGIQRWRNAKLIEIAAESGAKWALSIIDKNNLTSLRNNLKNKFKIFQMKEDRWRFFHCKTIFSPFSPSNDWIMENIFKAR